MDLNVATKSECMDRPERSPAAVMQAYLSRITAGEIWAIGRYFHAHASIHFTQGEEIVAVSRAELAHLIESWRTAEAFNPMIEIETLFDDNVLAVVRAAFGEPQGLRYHAVFNLHNGGEDGWRIWAANGHAEGPAVRSD